MKSTISLIVCLLLFSSLFFASSKIFAQEISPENLLYQKSLLNATAVYHQSFGIQGALYNGRQYKEYEVRFKEGFPYFQSPRAAVGTVIYGGVVYDSILMRYDEVTDELVVHDQIIRIQLLKEKVSFFNLFNTNFIQIQKDSLSDNLISSGFYNLLYQGKVSLLKKQIKILREDITANAELINYVLAKDYYYLKKDNEFFLIKKKSNLFEVMADKKKEVQQFIKDNNLSFKSDKQNMLTKITAYYDSLKK